MRQASSAGGFQSGATTASGWSESGILEEAKWPGVQSGYQRFLATPFTVLPGEDVTRCEYVMAPAVEDMNLGRVLGAQVPGGHHVTLFAVDEARIDHAIGEVFSCEPADGHRDYGTWMGGAAVSLPEGTALRINKGQGLMLNVHYVNTSSQPLEAKAVLDVKLSPATSEPNQQLVSMLVSVNTDIQIDPFAKYTSSIDCTLPVALDVVLAGNHMHELGVSANTSIVRSDGTVQVARQDDFWPSDAQLNPPVTVWSLDAPLHLNPGDAIRTTCSWANDTDRTIMFPKEMCISVMFVLLPSGQVSVPGACQSGAWAPRMNAE